MKEKLLQTMKMMKTLKVIVMLKKWRQIPQVV